MIEQLPSLDVRHLAQRAHHRAMPRQAGSPPGQRSTAARYTIERNALLGFGVIYLSSLAFDVIRIFTRSD